MTNETASTTGGIDLTPIYRAAAKAHMIQGAVCFAGGLISAALNPAMLYAGPLLMLVGVLKFGYGAIRLLSCNEPL
jgi:hypothetical protein